MDENDKRGTGRKKGAGSGRRGAGSKTAVSAAEKAVLVEKARQIVYQTPPLRLDRIAAVKEALEQGAYDIDSRKLANILITELILKR